MSFLPVDVIVDQKGKQKHRIDTLNILAYVVLLILVLVTTWFFKRRRKTRLYIHETGLAIIYGLIMGAALRYFGLEIKITSPQLNAEIPLIEPADYVTLEARNLGDKTNQTHLYAYEFRGELEPGTKLGSQISYASVDPEIFFNIILPPIVLNAGLSLKRRHFFRNIGAIFSYAFIGTTISVMFVGSFIYGSIHFLKMSFGYEYLAGQFSLANCLYFGAIISPTDPLAVLSIFQDVGVDVNLFALVFGESILNDAVSIVLTHSIDQFTVNYGRNPYYPIYLIIWECFASFVQMFLSSCLIGILFGIISALTTKFTKLNETPLLETSLVVLMSYSSFLTAEVIDSSGIVAILLCGITQAHYTINNLSFEARERLKNLFELLTFLCENFLFLAVGVAFWQRGQNWNFPFIGISFIGVTIARALSVYPLTAILNLGRRKQIPINYQHLIAWGGAARGVISYSLAARNTVGDARRMMLSTTSVIVIFSVIVVGGTVDSMLRCLKIPYRGSLEDQKQKRRRTDSNPTDQLLICDENELEHGCAGGDLCQHDEDGFSKHEPSICGPQEANARDPNWLIKQKRINMANSNTTPSAYTTSSKRSFSAQRQPTSSLTTPILEVESIWTSRQERNNNVIDRLPSIMPDECPTGNGTFEDKLECFPSNQKASSATATASTTSNSANLINTLAAATSTTTRMNTNNEEPQQHQQHVARCQRNENVIGYENASIVRYWKNLDNNFIKPLLTNSNPSLMETMPSSLRRLASFFTSDEQLILQRYESSQLLSSASLSAGGSAAGVGATAKVVPSRTVAKQDE